MTEPVAVLPTIPSTARPATTLGAGVGLTPPPVDVRPVLNLQHDAFDEAGQGSRGPAALSLPVGVPPSQGGDSLGWSATEATPSLPVTLEADPYRPGEQGPLQARYGNGRGLSGQFYEHSWEGHRTLKPGLSGQGASGIGKRLKLLETLADVGQKPELTEQRRRVLEGLDTAEKFGQLAADDQMLFLFDGILDPRRRHGAELCNFWLTDREDFLYWNVAPDVRHELLEATRRIDEELESVGVHQRTVAIVRGEELYGFALVSQPVDRIPEEYVDLFDRQGKLLGRVVCNPGRAA